MRENVLQRHGLMGVSPVQSVTAGTTADIQDALRAHAGDTPLTLTVSSIPSQRGTIYADSPLNITAIKFEFTLRGANVKLRCRRATHAIGIR